MVSNLLNLCAVAVALPIMDAYLKRKAANEMYLPVLNKLTQGLRPSLRVHAKRMPREEILSFMCNKFLLETWEKLKETHFGVTFGPSSSGKTSAMRELCDSHPEGVLYYEIHEPTNFVYALGQEIGMKTSPSTALDFLLSYISERHHHYHLLPPNDHRAFDMVMEVLTCFATSYVKSRGKIPILFIDGIDILAKRDVVLCSTVV